MSELEATPLERATAAQMAHELAWRRQRIADLAGLPIEAAMWHDIKQACIDEMGDCVVAIRAMNEAELVHQAAAANDGILRGNADLVSESAIYRSEVA
ncbi:hypothetical protein [Pseudoxanthomonas sp. GW2]|uniref:hypothetical protein n=1 Tax=Pseudoxanthomonas sp. GW2 TaxID=1211114 RepID=UPI0002DC236D|nr:hypothetical protein [Pseudoxanthomonas sp. GW2]